MRSSQLSKESKCLHFMPLLAILFLLNRPIHNQGPLHYHLYNVAHRFTMNIAFSKTVILVGWGVSCNTSFRSYKAKLVPLVALEQHYMTIQVPAAKETAMLIEFDEVA